MPGSPFPSDGASPQLPGFPVHGVKVPTKEVCLGGSWGEPHASGTICPALQGRDQPLISGSCFSPSEAGALC